MTKKSDYLFLNLKQLYPEMSAPAPIDEEIWAELLSPYTLKEIYSALKNHRQSSKGSRLPTPAQFKEYLFPQHKKNIDDDLPLSPENHLMEEDIKADRCKYFFHTYVRGVHYVLHIKLKEIIKEETLARMDRGTRYRIAVENGLFGDFEEVLDYVYKERY